MHRRNDRRYNKRPYEDQSYGASWHQNQQGPSFRSPGPQRQPQGSPHTQQRGFGSPNRLEPGASRTWFTNGPYQGGQNQGGQNQGGQIQGGQYQGSHQGYGDAGYGNDGYGDDAGYGNADESNVFRQDDPGFRRQVDQGRQDRMTEYSPWNGRRSGEPLYDQGDPRSRQDSGNGQAKKWWQETQPPNRTPKKSSERKRTPDRQSKSGDEEETAKTIDFTKRDQELARELKSPNQETPHQALALVAASMETPKSDARSGDSARERMDALYDEATKVLPPSSEHYKKVLMSVVRSTFQHACAATRVVLRNNPKLLAEGQEQLLPGAPWGPIPCEEPHYWHSMCDIHCEVHLPRKVHAAIQQQGVWPHPPKSHEAQVLPEEIAVFWNFTQKEWDEIPNDRRKKALMTISQRTDVPKGFNPKSPVWNESVSGLTRLQKVADKVWSFTDAELDHANAGDPTRLSKDEKHAMAAASACSQLLQVADENIPKSDKEEQDESWRLIKIQRLHYIEYAKLLDRFAPGTAYENGPQQLGIDRHFWRALDENRQLRDSILAENGDDGSQLVFNQECTSEEDELWSDEGPWSTEQTQLWNDVHGDDQAYWREWEQRLDKRRWAKQSAAHVKYKAERLRRFLSIDADKIANFEATHYNYLAGRVQGAVAAVHSYHHLCLVPTVLIDDGASWRLDLVEQKIQSVCVLEDQDLSDWTKQFTGKSSVLPTTTANAIKHLSRAPGSGHNNQRHLDTLLPWLKLIGLDQVLLAILTGNLRVTVSHKTKMTQIALQQCRDICNRQYKVLPTEMKFSRQQLQFERDFCVKNPTVLLVDLNKLASMLHLAYRDFYFNLSDAEKEYHQKVRTPESLLAHLDMYVLVSPAPDQGKYEHRQKLRKSVLARKRPTASIRDWMAEF